MQFIPSYIKDTTEFINRLACARTISSEVLLTKMDVTSLYANIPHVDRVDACSKFLNDHCVTDISTDVLCYLISFILAHIHFVLMMINICKLTERRWVQRWRYAMLTFSWHLSSINTRDAYLFVIMHYKYITP